MPDAHIQRRNRWTYKREYLGDVRGEEPRVDAEPRVGAKSRVDAKSTGGAETGL
jgi:hypothetical protein